MKKILFLSIILLTIYVFRLFNTISKPSDVIIQKDPNLKYVQLYTGKFDYKDWKEKGLGKIPFEECDEKRCFAFKPHVTQTAVENADGVLVHGPNLWYLPSRKHYKRNTKQIWLYYSLESPRGSMCSSHINDNDLDDWFNLTATYKQDSSFIIDYSKIKNWNDVIFDKQFLTYYIKMINDHPLDFLKSNWKENILGNKKKKKAQIFWLVSHCETHSRREEYIKTLRKYIDIDIYGSCEKYFENSLPDPCPKGSPPDCLNNLFESYKFYLSFENSLCDDYISEKYWKIYNPESLFVINTVPIARGATVEQFKKVAPAKSLINAYEYKTPETLGEYLNYLNKNDTAYLEYFNWKLQLYDKFEKAKDTKKATSFNLESKQNSSPFCKICQALHNQTFMNNDHKNPVWKLSKWFGKGSCWDYEENRRFFYWTTQLLGFCF